MISKKLQNRLKHIKATPLKNRVQTSTFSRRDGNYVIMEEEGSELDKYDTFFDYEEELADLKPSGEQYTEMIDSEPFVILEEKMEDNSDIFEPITMEEHNVEADVNLLIDNEASKKYTDVVGFEFVQCEFTKKDGIRCKRQAPKGGSICSTHKRYIDKHGSK